MSQGNKAALEETIYTAYHDIKEPLRIITAVLEEVTNTSDKKLNDELIKKIKRALATSKNVQQLLQNMLEYSRIDADKNFARIHLGEVFELTLNNIALMISETSAKISHSTFPVVDGNFSQLIRLFQNLLCNSIKFCTQKKPEIVITSKEFKKFWQISIADNGIGFDAESMVHIFKPFKRLHSHKEFTGSGLGLAICQRIIENHSGKIWATSIPGKGSTFNFTLPKEQEKK